MKHINQTNYRIVYDENHGIAVKEFTESDDRAFQIVPQSFFTVKVLANRHQVKKIITQWAKLPPPFEKAPTSRNAEADRPLPESDIPSERGSAEADRPLPESDIPSESRSAEGRCPLPEREVSSHNSFLPAACRVRIYPARAAKKNL